MLSLTPISKDINKLIFDYMDFDYDSILQLDDEINGFSIYQYIAHEITFGPKFYVKENETKSFRTNRIDKYTINVLVIRAEIFIAYLTAQQNLPFRLSDKLDKGFRSIFPDSVIANQ